MVVTVERLTSWAVALDLARATAGRPAAGIEPTAEWKRRILRADHSPVRAVLFKVTMENIPYWVSVHLTRHKIGVEHFVSTQRPDRTGRDVDRDELPQGAPVTHTMLANASALMAISRKRLCNLAAKETRAVWQAVKDAVARVDAEMAEAMVPECRHRNGCPEMRPCRAK